VVEVLLSAFILGTTMTALPLHAYFADPLFAHYFFNMLGEPQYFLPGLFLDNPLPAFVNFQLWTVPFELGCYITLAAVALLNVRKRPIVVPLAAIVFTIGYVLVRILYNHGFPELARPIPGPLLVICFLVGVSAYLYRDRIPANHILGIIAGLASVLCLSLPAIPQFLAPWPIAYFTIYLGTLNPRRIALIAGADYSYGLYLYGYPIQQAIAHLGPWTHNAMLNFAGAVTLASCFAAISWHCIEKPALRSRSMLKALEDRWLASRLGGAMFRSRMT
jgi:peptidoglycan/LPS O-acetylase OafA/YrhL